MYIWGAFPATLLMLLTPYVAADFDPWYLGALWFAAVLLGVVGLWLAVFQNPIKSPFYCITTFIFLVAGIIAEIPLAIPLLWIEVKSLIKHLRLF
ncbi:hypothetical protein ACH50O_15655 [Methylomonas sp. 2BW1-5-20]|uniref:hypothetical protein n=1 Tax=Methylomonas sp. 2BW1-5-20 TaxID=3376686 RepID=UPI00404EF8D7